MHPRKAATLSGMLVVIFAISVATECGAVEFESGMHRNHLLELYTSEGCSSCPPADRWLSTLSDDPRLWHSVVPVAFHVDYWDYIGWSDRFAKPTHSQRQRQYAANKHVSTVYTPGFILNGREWRGWFRRESIPESSAPGGQLRVDLANETVTIAFKPASATEIQLTATVVWLGMGLNSEVKAGENRGRNLSHDFVALDTDDIKLERKDGAYRALLPTPASLPVPATALAAWVQETGDLTPLQAVGGWIDAADAAND